MLACLLRFGNRNLGLSAEIVNWYLGLSAKIRKSLSITTDASVKGVLIALACLLSFVYRNLGLSAKI